MIIRDVSQINLLACSKNHFLHVNLNSSSLFLSLLINETCKEIFNFLNEWLHPNKVDIPDKMQIKIILVSKN